MAVDRPLNHLEKLFCATCGVKVEAVPVDDKIDLPVDSTDNAFLAGVEAEQARVARLRGLSEES